MTPWTCGRPKIELQFGAADAPIPLIMKRFLPYLRYLRGRRIALMSALIFGAISAVVYGWGLPTVMKDVFPKIFTDASGAAASPTGMTAASPFGSSESRSAAASAASSVAMSSSYDFFGSRMARYEKLKRLY